MYNGDGNLDGNSDTNLQGDNLEGITTLKYVGSTSADNIDLGAETTHKIRSGWKKWKRITGVQCDRRISLMVRGKCKTNNDVRCRDMGSEASTRKGGGCGGNQDIKMY